MSTSKTYDELRKINVNEHVEKKNNLSYLSWAWAVDILFQHDPDASWDYTLFDGKPWMVVGDSYMVFCTVKAFGRERTAQLPIMDYKNKAVMSFTSFDLNTTMQRCLAKAISLHGIGLYIYAGEDLPEGEEPEKKDRNDSPNKSVTREILSEGMLPEVKEGIRLEAKAIEGDFYTISGKAGLTRWLAFKKDAAEAEVDLCWSLMDSKVRNGIKKIGEANLISRQVEDQAHAA